MAAAAILVAGILAAGALGGAVAVSGGVEVVGGGVAVGMGAVGTEVVRIGMVVLPIGGGVIHTLMGLMVGNSDKPENETAVPKSFRCPKE